MNREQKEVLLQIQKGNNVFITGAAGSGKTYTIKNIVGWAIENEKNIGVTATTGISALLINGKTIYSFLGLGLGKKNVKEIIIDIQKKKFIKKRILLLELLIIDEISMLGISLLEKINQILMIIRDNDKPFGGLQIIFCGDFAQLPPVNDRYCFLSPVWKELNLVTVFLRKNYRQQEDTKFQEILNRLRQGQCSDSDIELLLNTYNNYQDHDQIEPTILYTKNINVQALNMNRLKQLNQDIVTYKSVFSSNISKIIAKTQNIDESVALCLGAQVILTRNMDQDTKLVNGSRGVIIGLQKDRVKVRFKNRDQWISVVTSDLSDKEDMSLWCSYIPLKLAYALTIHKSQGMTIDCLQVDLSDTFEYGQAYTAISRTKNLESIKIVNIKKKAFKTHPDVLEFYQVFKTHPDVLEFYQYK